MIICIYCNSDIHFLCVQPSETLDCCCVENPDAFVAPDDAIDYALSEHKKLGAPFKAPEDMKNILATGRKRSIEAKPIYEGDICEWSELLKAGGGRYPIIGCERVLATDVHHGPDKSVLNNDLSNLHKLCKRCHNRWHSLNDPEFDPVERPGLGATWVIPNALPHDPDTKATEEDRISNDLWWSIRRDKSRNTKRRDKRDSAAVSAGYGGHADSSE